MSLLLYWDMQNQQMITGLNSATAISQFNFVLRDTLPVVLRVVAAQANINVPYVVTAIDAGKSIKFGAKALATYMTDTEFLFSQATWTQSGSGVNTIYSANLSLNTAALIAALSTSAYLDCKAEFTILNGSNENELSTQFTMRICPDVIKNTEGVPSTEFPVIAQYLDDNNLQAVRIVDAEGVVAAICKKGSLYPFCATTGLYYPVSIIIQDGIPTLSIGAGENL